MTSCSARGLGAVRGKGEKGKSERGAYLPLSLAGPHGLGCLASLGPSRPDQDGAKAKLDGFKKTGDGTRENQGSWGSFGGPLPRQIHGIPGSVGSARYRRRASPASRHPAEPSSHDSGRRRSMPSKSSTIADQLATTQESKVSVQMFPLAVGHHHTSGPRCNGEARGGVMAFLPKISSVVYCVDSWTRWPP